MPPSSSIFSVLIVFVYPYTHTLMRCWPKFWIPKLNNQFILSIYLSSSLTNLRGYNDFFALLLSRHLQHKSYSYPYSYSHLFLASFFLNSKFKEKNKIKYKLNKNEQFIYSFVCLFVFNFIAVKSALTILVFGVTKNNAIKINKYIKKYRGVDQRVST